MRFRIVPPRCGSVQTVFTWRAVRIGLVPYRSNGSFSETIAGTSVAGVNLSLHLNTFASR